jgi:hypothetical protein
MELPMVETAGGAGRDSDGAGALDANIEPPALPAVKTEEGAAGAGVAAVFAGAGVGWLHAGASNTEAGAEPELAGADGGALSRSINPELVGAGDALERSTKGAAPVDLELLDII